MLKYMQRELNERIVINPAIMTGKPVMNGTRIPVDMIVRLLAQGMTLQEILEDYPQLKKDDIKTALEYLADMIRGEEAFPMKE